MDSFAQCMLCIPHLHLFLSTGHQVHPSKVAEYKSLLANHYPAIVEESSGQLGQAKLTGSWEVTVGDLETFCE